MALIDKVRNWYDFETTAWADYHGSLHLTGVNTPSVEAGKVGNGVQLTFANTEYLTASDASLNFGSSDWEVVGWFYHDFAANVDPRVFSIHNESGAPIAQVFVLDVRAALDVYNTSGTRSRAQVNGAFSSNTWYCFRAYRSGANVHFEVRGVGSASAGITGALRTGTTYSINWGLEIVGNGLEGFLDSCAICDPLTTDEWDEFWNGGAGVSYFDIGEVIPLSSYTGKVLDLDPHEGAWQDTAGTTPASSVGDPIGRVDDQSGGGWHATQATALNKPLLGTGDNTWKTIEYDGSVQRLVSLLAPSQPFTAVLVAKLGASPASRNEQLLMGNSGTETIYHNELGQHRSRFANQIKGGTVDENRNVVTIIANGSASGIYANGDVQVEGDLGAGSPSRVTLGSHVTASPVASYYRLLIFDRALSRKELVHLSALLEDTYGNAPTGGGGAEPVDLSGTAAGQAQADADVLRSVLVQAQASGSGAATAGIRALRQLQAVASGQAGTQALPEIDRLLSAAASGAGDAEIQARVNRLLSSAAAGSGIAIAAIRVARSLSTTASSLGGAEADVSQAGPISLSASASGLSGAEADVLRTLLLNASASGSGGATANLVAGAAILLASTASGVSDAEAELLIERLIAFEAGGRGQLLTAMFITRLLSATAAGRAGASATIQVGDPLQWLEIKSSLKAQRLYSFVFRAERRYSSTLAAVAVTP